MSSKTYLRPTLAAVLALSWLIQGAVPTQARAAPPATDARMALSADAEPLPADQQLGASIYLRGVGTDGRVLQASRPDGSSLSGADAACVHCHRRSGLGQVEGQVVIPPISSHALFEERGRLVLMMDTRSKRAWNGAHAPYDSAALARAISAGVAVDGRSMLPLMPRYALDAQELASLERYLRQLSLRWSPGVTPTGVDLATVLTPELQGERRVALKATIDAFVARHNLGTTPNRRHMTGATQFVLKSERPWRHRYWELSGTPDTWPAQLDALYAQAPVFALVGGGAGDWRNIDRFCAQHEVPCWFPSAELPAPNGTAERIDMALHFDRGVLLEADLLAATLPREASVRVEYDPADDVARAAAQAFAHARGALSAASPAAAVPALASDAGAAVVPAAAGGADATVVICWCRAQRVSAWLAEAPPAAQVYLSATLLGGGLQAWPEGVPPAQLPAPWRAALRLVSAQAERDTALANLHLYELWRKTAGVPRVDDTLQSQNYFAFAWISETLSEMLFNLQREYLLERGTTMLDRREELTAAAEVRSEASLREIATHREERAHAVVEHAGTTVYPRLSLGIGQRFAARGARVLRLEEGGTDAAALHWVPAGDWLVP